MRRKGMMKKQKVPRLADVFNASQVIGRYLRPTPLHHYPALSEALGCEAYVKHENHQPVGAFKVRGGLYLISRLADDERRAGVVSKSDRPSGSCWRPATTWPSRRERLRWPRAFASETDWRGRKWFFPCPAATSPWASSSRFSTRRLRIQSPCVRR